MSESTLSQTAVLLDSNIIPDNDLWIAALAKQHDLTLVSRDQHFSHVTGVKWVVW